MYEELKYIVTPSKKIDDNILTLSEINLPKEQNGPSEVYIEENIQRIFSKEYDDQLASIRFFEYQLKYYEIILPYEYLEITIDIFQSHLDDSTLINLLLAFYRHCTGFESEMQDYLIEKDLVAIVIPFFPQEDVLAILGNLSIKNMDILNQLLTMGVLGQIFPLIDIFKEEKDQSSEELLNFGNSIDLLDSLLYNFDGEPFAAYIPMFVEIFDALCLAYENISIDLAIRIAEVFSNYIEADSVFIQSFYEKNQFKLFLEKEYDDNKIDELIIKMMDSIISEYEYQGVKYLYEFDIIDWLGKRILSDSQEVIYRSFSILSKLICRCDPPKIMADEIIKSDFLMKAVDKFYTDILYRLKFSLYEFICTLFSNASDDQIPLMIEEKALDLIVNNYEIADDQQSVSLIWNSLQRLLPFLIKKGESEEEPDKEISIVHEAIQNIKTNAIFIDWMLNCRDSETDFDSDWHDEVLILFVNENEEQQL